MADDTTPAPWIEATENGPFVVHGDVPLRRRRALHTEHGEPIAWQTTADLPAESGYELCRCGQSQTKPFCDWTHTTIDFQADDIADAYDTFAERAERLGGTGITVYDDDMLCIHAGFCGNRVTKVKRMVGDTNDSLVRISVAAMIEKCPAGALAFEIDGEFVEPLLPQAIAVVDDGALWVTGGIPVRTADGRTIETRNRVTLCRCGQSTNKPLCDGTHKDIGFTDR